MCSLAVVMAAYLCSYIQSVEQSLRVKAIAIIDTLMQSGPPATDPAAQSYYTER